MQTINSSCVAPKAVSKHGAVNARTAQARPCIVRRQSHAAARSVSISRQGFSRTSTVRCQAALDPETVTNATYATLGLTALSFVGTFFGECWLLWPAGSLEPAVVQSEACLDQAVVSLPAAGRHLHYPSRAFVSCSRFSSQRFSSREASCLCGSLVG